MRWGFLLLLILMNLSLSNAMTVFSDPNGGYFSSPDYHSNYPNDLSTTYMITVPQGFYIRITFFVFHTEKNYDTLSIYDGNSTDAPQIAELSGSRSGTVLISTGNNIYMDFETDLAVNDRGFYAQYEVFQIGVSPPTFTGCPPSFYSTSDFLAVTSPNWPRNYTELLDCHYYLEVDRESTVHLMIEAFQTEHFDYLRIYDGPNESSKLLDELRDSPSTPIDYVSTTNEMLLVFSTDLLYTDIGFSAVFWPQTNGKWNGKGKENQEEQTKNEKSKETNQKPQLDAEKSKPVKGDPVKADPISSLFHLRPARHLLIP